MPAPDQSMVTTGTPPTTPGIVAAGQRGYVPGPAINSAPSSIRIASRPLTWYWKCGASQFAVPAIGFTSFDQREPGWRTSRPARRRR